jgi:muramoyltetrapeptide carboxypeptidase
MAKIPPYLKKGDTIGIVAPAGYMSFDRMEICVNTLQDWGYTVKLGETTHSNSFNYFSGTDEERLTDLQTMLDDREVKAILFARGGYGMSRIIDRINFKRLKRSPKWLIGYSDITVLHSHVYSRYDIATLHAPMAAAFNDGDNEFITALKNAIEGIKADYRCDAHELNRLGEASGRLIGGNLTLLVHAVGTPSDILTKKKILFVEDIGEHLYNIDRMFLQLKRSGKLDRLTGLVIGGFTDNKDTERPFGKTVEEIIYDQVKDYRFPVCFDFPVSHNKENYALKVGLRYHLKVSAEGVQLKEL